ncbi:MAG: response regulator transcription factor [Archangium sp.]|nr:response regulator transcription factor [Archangium sp.]
MKGLPPKTMPLRVAIQAEPALIEALSAGTESLILSPVETNLEISARVTQADVVLVDTTVNTAQALEAIRTLQLKRPILALVAPGQAQAALTAGATGAIERNHSASAIEAALFALRQGLSVVESKFLESAGATAAHVTLTPPVPGEKDVLTRREHEVVGLMADGLSNKQIAAKLEISEHTAKFHVNSVLQKMHAQKRVEAVVRAAKMGIISI